MKYQIILLASAALVSTAAIAGDDKDKDSKGATSTFKTLDADADGKLSKEEVAGNEGLSGSFDRLDSNSDGYVSKREFQRNTMPKRDSSASY
jgi:Ca2+-binding EF-hand superfamily protein